MHAHDPQHWLYRFTPREWIHAALAEIAGAESAIAQRSRKGALAGCRRAAGMAINAILALQEAPNPSYGRTYMEHLAALSHDAAVTDVVRDSARVLVETPLPGGPIVVLRTELGDARLIEAARNVMAHAYAYVVKSE